MDDILTLDCTGTSYLQLAKLPLVCEASATQYVTVSRTLGGYRATYNAGSHGGDGPHVSSVPHPDTPRDIQHPWLVQELIKNSICTTMFNAMTARERHDLYDRIVDVIITDAFFRMR